MRTYVRTALLYWWTIFTILCVCGQSIGDAAKEVDAECLGSAKQALGDRDVIIIAGIGGYVVCSGPWPRGKYRLL